MIGHGHSRDFPIITFPPFYLCAAGIGRTAQADPGTGVPAQTACRETYGLLLYAVRSLHPAIRGGRSHLPHGTNICGRKLGGISSDSKISGSQVRILSPAQEAG